MAGFGLGSSLQQGLYNLGLIENPFSNMNYDQVNAWIANNVTDDMIASSNYSPQANMAFDRLAALSGSTGGGVGVQPTSLIGSLGGFGNIMQGLGALGGLYTSIRGLGLQEDALDLAEDQYNMNRNLNQANLNNSIDAYNASLQDRLTTRAKANTGNRDAYNDLIEERTLDKVTL